MKVSQHMNQQVDGTPGTFRFNPGQFVFVSSHDGREVYPGEVVGVRFEQDGEVSYWVNWSTPDGVRHDEHITSSRLSREIPKLAAAQVLVFKSRWASPETVREVGTALAVSELACGAKNGVRGADIVQAGTEPARALNTTRPPVSKASCRSARARRPR